MRKILLLITSIIFLLGCTPSLEPYKDKSQYDIIYSCNKLVEHNKYINESKKMNTDAQFSISSKNGKLIYNVLNQEPKYAKYYSREKDGTVIYMSVSERLTLGYSNNTNHGVTFGINYHNTFIKFYECNRD